MIWFSGSLSRAPATARGAVSDALYCYKKLYSEKRNAQIVTEAVPPLTYFTFRRERAETGSWVRHDHGQRRALRGQRPADYPADEGARFQPWPRNEMISACTHKPRALGERSVNVRFHSESGHSPARSRCPFSARSSNSHHLLSLVLDRRATRRPDGCQTDSRRLGNGDHDRMKASRSELITSAFVVHIPCG
jgi:hypothetical protein